MKSRAIEGYRCPTTGAALHVDDAKVSGDEISFGRLVSKEQSYRVVDGVPIFAADEKLSGSAAFARNYYASIASTYDENVQVTFDLYNDSELDVRRSMIDLLTLKPNSRVLEISAGTGKDSDLIAQRLGEEGQLWLLDISPDMLAHAKQKLSKYPIWSEAAVGDACYLPYADDYFDALYCFAGVGHFTDAKRALHEMARVVRPGGRVVFAEKNVPPWLRDTEYGKILINNNPMFADQAPLNLIPKAARNAGIRWILGNVHYVIDYTVGVGAPVGNFDLELPGNRGGTFNTRYFGKLEGVTPEVKALVERAAKRRGVSVHKWLVDTLKAHASEDLD